MIKTSNVLASSPILIPTSARLLWERFQRKALRSSTQRCLITCSKTRHEFFIEDKLEVVIVDEDTCDVILLEPAKHKHRDSNFGQISSKNKVYFHFKIN